MTRFAAALPRLGLCFATLALAIYCPPVSADCSAEASLEQFAGQGWGLDLENRRFQADSRIDAANVSELELAWVFALDGGMSPHSYPVVSGDGVFIGSQGGNLYALERETGCERWRYQGDRAIRSGILHGRLGNGEVRLFYGSEDGQIHSLDARSGEHLWGSRIAQHSFATPTGTPSFHADRLFVPVSSFEVAMAAVPLYGCCTFRGALLALDAKNGETLWRAHTIPEEPRVTGRRMLFIEKWGPSGAPVWSAPTYDLRSNLLYIGTGENYSPPATETSDAIIAIDASSGERRWVYQGTQNDVFNMGCSISAEHPNCPEANGPDLDFGAPPMLVDLRDGRRLLIAGQKSGDIYALAPETGELIWRTKIGRGGFLGGVHWGMAVNERLGLLYVPISDENPGQVPGESAAGLHALELTSGELRWSYESPDTCEAKPRCWSGFSAAIIATEELVFAGALDGMLRAFDASTGDVLWSFQTWRDYQSVNGLDAEGGAIDVHGPILFEDMLLVQSGYASFSQAGGNALLAFSFPGS